MDALEGIPSVSVIVLNHNGARWLRDCLESLKGQSFRALEIIVVDAASTDCSREIVSGIDGVRLIALQDNPGFGKANNLGAAEAAGEWLIFVNADMRFEGTFIEELVRATESDNSVFSADACQYNWEGDRIVHRGTVLRRRSFPSGDFLPGVSKDVLVDLADGSEIPHACGSSMIVRKVIFDKLAGFDETFVFDWEDVDLGWRAWLYGHRSVYVPKAVCYHFGGGSFDSTRASQKRRRWCGRKNFFRFVGKTMPLAVLISVVLVVPMSVIWFLLSGKAWMAKVEVQALMATWDARSEIVSNRRTITVTCRESCASILARFLAVHV